MAESNGAAEQPDVDVGVVGAGFAGLYMLHRLRGLGFTATVLEAADDVGGTWYWNRYPGSRCDIPTTDYTFGFDPELESAWTWSEKYATQPEILRYLRFVAERYDLRRDIRFSTKATDATWDEAAQLWRIGADPGPGVTTRYYVMATGCLSVPKDLDIPGADRFTGEVYFTSRWPHEGVDFTGKRVGVVGTGSSGIQSIPLIAEQAAELTVFQRTPNFSIPAGNGPAPEKSLAEIAADRDGYRERAKWSPIGVPREPALETAAMLSPEERKRRFDAAVEEGTLGGILSLWADMGTNPAANDLVRDLMHERIKSIVRDPETAEALCPTDHYFGTKRPCLDTGYYETYNKPHVSLVNLRKEPISTVTETGIETAERTFEFDAIVYATGFDAMTGAIVGVDITGTGGQTLKQKWEDGPHTYLGLLSRGFPNLFMITGPESPSVLSNMAVSIEQHVDWIADCLKDMREGASPRSSRPRPPRPAGACTTATAPRSPCTPRPTPGTWARTCLASRGSSWPTSAASTATGRRRTRSASTATSGSTWRVRVGRRRRTTGWSAASSPTWRWCCRPWPSSNCRRWSPCHRRRRGRSWSSPTSCARPARRSARSSTGCCPAPPVT